MDEELNPLDQMTDLEDAVEAFMNSEYEEDDESLPDTDEEELTEAEEAEETEEETYEDDEEDSESDPEDDPEDDEEDDDEVEPEVASDDHDVVVTVDGAEHRVSVKDLKRLYGQEASLTQKSQAIAEQRRLVESQGLYLANILQQRYEHAQAQAKKYAGVDLFRASRELDDDEFEALRAAKENAESELQALEREGQEFLHRSTQTRNELLRAQAKESLKEITKAIPDWSDELYGEIRTYAVSQGMDADTANEIIDPSAISMMHKAMLYDKAQRTTATVKKKVTKAPKRVVKKSEKVTDNQTSKMKAKRRAAVESGDVDDVTDFFLAAMSEDE